MQASLFSQSWASQGRAVVERLRGRTFFPTQLDGINWRLNLSMAQASQSKMKLPNAQFECQWYKDRRGDSWPIMQCAYYCLLLADTSVNNAKFSRENIFANLQVLAQTVIFAFREMQVSHAPYRIEATTMKRAWVIRMISN